MGLVKIFTNKWFYINILAILLFWVAIVYFTGSFLDKTTLHGETVEVPNLKTYDLAEAEEVLKKAGLRYRVIDSSSFFYNFPKGAVIKQFPQPGKKVKLNRELLLSVNPHAEEKAQIPDLQDRSIRQAMQLLDRSGFKIGKLRLVPDIGRHVVLWAEHKGDSLTSDAKLPKRSEIDLVLGDGNEPRRMYLPDLKGRPYKDALYTARVNVLNPSAFRFDETVKDTLSAFVYKQFPDLSNTRFIEKGSEIELWFTQDQNKLNP